MTAIYGQLFSICLNQKTCFIKVFRQEDFPSKNHCLDKSILRPGPASSVGRAFAYKSSNPRLIQHEAEKFIMYWGDVSCARGNICATKSIIKILTQFNKLWYWRSCHLLEEIELHTISTERKGNVAWTNWSCDIIHLVMSDVISLFYATLQPTLQPLHHQPTRLTYCGAQAMDVTGRDKTWVPSKGKAPQRVIVKRSIGQWDRTWDKPWNRGCPG